MCANAGKACCLLNGKCSQQWYRATAKGKSSLPMEAPEASGPSEDLWLSAIF